MKNFKSYSFYLLLILVLMFALFFSTQNTPTNENQYGYTEFLAEIDRVERVEIKQNVEIPTGQITVWTDNIESKSFFMSDVNLIYEDLKMNGIPVYTLDVPRANWFISLLPSIVIMVAVVFLFMFIMNQAQGGGGGNRVMSFGKSKAKMMLDEDKNVTFDKVAGLEEEKDELEEVVEFLKSPKKFVEVGARIPKGVLLVGPPGTGKTLLAKAVAGEAGVPFFSISGSDFVEMFVGVGASRVRDLFENAKKNAPCIVFIDEIDAVGRKRGAGLGGGHDEREQTLNQLLVEMDGFGINEGVIVIAATNRVDILDPALLRPGRFDRKVFVGRPDVKGREEILKVHAKGKPLSDDVSLKEIAATTAGFTGADLENLLNEAAIYAARSDQKVINQSDLRHAFVRVGIGTEKRSRVISEKEKRITAYHEAGHAILFEELEELDPVHSISIIPTGMAGGYTMPLPSKDPMYMTKKKMEQEIVSLLGGRAAEKLVLDDITTGASNDIERASAIARNMVVKYGMSDVIGPIQFGSDNEEVFIGRDWGHTRNYGENIAGLIDSEIKRMVDSGYEEAKSILENHIDILHKTADLLMEKEKITGAQFRALFEAKKEGILDEVELDEASVERLLFGNKSKEETNLETES
ncbi:MAG: cell division protein FtsH [Firmicutes bacterium HGW-Firmicutes-2]|jgi:cell division protease FtsH|nr:MAG: cell division protein FtsH [Firmicutes bacterium HGW-Firmicutes-2]